MSDFRKAIEESRKRPASVRCQFNCSKYCLIVDAPEGMSKVGDKLVCKACYNCAVKDKEGDHLQEMFARRVTIYRTEEDYWKWFICYDLIVNKLLLRTLSRDKGEARTYSLETT